MTIGQDHMVPQHALLLGAQTLDRPLRTLVARVRLNLHADALQPLEGMLEQQVLAFGIDARPAIRRSVPCAANFKAPMRRADLKVAGAACNTTGSKVDDGKRHICALRTE